MYMVAAKEQVQHEGWVEMGNEGLGHERRVERTERNLRKLASLHFKKWNGSGGC